MTTHEFLVSKGVKSMAEQFGAHRVEKFMEEYSTLTFLREKTTRDRIIEFQDALIQILETHKDGDLKSQLFIDSYKSTIEELKEQL